MAFKKSYLQLLYILPVNIQVDWLIVHYNNRHYSVGPSYNTSKLTLRQKRKPYIYDFDVIVWLDYI